MHRVYEMVKREAERYGAAPVGSEIVGLIPKKAIEMAANYFLQLENFSPAQVFENKLEAVLSGAPVEAKDGKLANLARPFLEGWRNLRPRRRGQRIGTGGGTRGSAGTNGRGVIAQEEVANRVCG